jgi:tetrathionate reductase subunit B
VQECVGNARYFGDLNDKQSEVYELLKKQVYKRLEEEAGTEPNVYYIGL